MSRAEQARDDWVLVDTSGWICFFARKGFPEIKSAIGQLLDEDRAATCGPVLVEIIQGTRTETERDDMLRRLSALHWLEITQRHWRQAAVLAFRLRRKGVTVSAIDALISATAMDYHCQLLHHDSDYLHIARHSALQVFDLTPYTDATTP